MAALTQPASPQVTELRGLRAAHLEPLLAEETAAWRTHLDWDFSPSADLVKRFVDQQALQGFALLARGIVAGYSYYVQDQEKGLLGDLFVMRDFRDLSTENQLLEATVRQLMATPGVRRIETQLILLGADPGRPAPAWPWLRRFERNFMRLDFAAAPELPPAPPNPRVAIEHWAEWHQEAAAQLIPEAYAGHVDGAINDQYRTPEGARRFLHNIVQYPGCGAFYRPASFVALDRDTGSLCGLSLASKVAADVGHLTQICVGSRQRGRGTGYDLMRHSLRAFAEAGCRKVSLTVTAANENAVALYERTGFICVRKFHAWVWEGF